MRAVISLTHDTLRDFHVYTSRKIEARDRIEPLTETADRLDLKRGTAAFRRTGIDFAHGHVTLVPPRSRHPLRGSSKTSDPPGRLWNFGRSHTRTSVISSWTLLGGPVGVLNGDRSGKRLFARSDAAVVAEREGLYLVYFMLTKSGCFWWLLMRFGVNGVWSGDIQYPLVGSRYVGTVEVFWFRK